MNAIVLLSAHRQPPKPVDDRLPVFPDGADNDEIEVIGSIRGEEAILNVRFSGLSAADQERALASFPGGRRCILDA